MAHRATGDYHIREDYKTFREPNGSVFSGANDEGSFSRCFVRNPVGKAVDEQDNGRQKSRRQRCGDCRQREISCLRKICSADNKQTECDDNRQFAQSAINQLERRSGIRISESKPHESETGEIYILFRINEPASGERAKRQKDAGIQKRVCFTESVILNGATSAGKRSNVFVSHIVSRTVIKIIIEEVCRNVSGDRYKYDCQQRENVQLTRDKKCRCRTEKNAGKRDGNKRNAQAPKKYIHIFTPKR